MAPATPADAKGLLIAAIATTTRSSTWRAKSSTVQSAALLPEGEYVVPIGAAHTVREGSDLSVITYGAQVREAREAAGRLSEEGIEAEILDLRTLKPLDTEAILESARKTGKVLIVHSATGNTGVGAEVAALIAQEAFEWLDAPIQPSDRPGYSRALSAQLWRTPTAPSADKIYARAKELTAF